MMHVFTMDELYKVASRLRLAAEYVGAGVAHHDDEVYSRRALADAVSEMVHALCVISRVGRDEFKIENAERFDPTHLHRVSSAFREGADALESECECVGGMHDSKHCKPSGMPARVEPDNGAIDRAIVLESAAMIADEAAAGPGEPGMYVAAAKNIARRIRALAEVQP